MRKTLICLSLLASGSALAATPPKAAAPASNEALMQQIQLLSQQMQQMQQQLTDLKSKYDQVTQQQSQQAQQTQQAAKAASDAQAQVVAQAAAQAEQAQLASVRSSSPFDDLRLWGYGEVYYMHPVHEPQNTQADLARAVFGIGYRFDDRTRFNSEFEVEHAVASSGDSGEFEVEQFYAEHDLGRWGTATGGVFLMPFGLLNEHHEPTAYFGVQRNFIETLIIPSTWREAGFNLHGTTRQGIRWNTGITTGISLAKWDPNPETPPYTTALELEDSDIAPLQATHQEVSFANAQHPAEYLSLNYDGIPGFNAGAAIFTGNAALPTQPVGLPDSRATLWEVHTRWTPKRFDLSALYARGTLTNTAAYNLANAGASNPLPSKFYGYFLQGGYTVWQNATYRLTPFVRWERYSLGAGYEGIPAGFSTVPSGPVAGSSYGWPRPYDRIWTYGTNFYITPHVVLKADYQSFGSNSNFTRFDLGLGLYY